MSTWISNFTESEQYIINDDGPKNSEENFEDKTPEQKEDSIKDYIGGFQLLDLIITELKSHMTC